MLVTVRRVLCSVLVGHRRVLRRRCHNRSTMAEVRSGTREDNPFADVVAQKPRDEDDSTILGSLLRLGWITDAVLGLVGIGVWAFERVEQCNLSEPYAVLLIIGSALLLLRSASSLLNYRATQCLGLYALTPALIVSYAVAAWWLRHSKEAWVLCLVVGLLELLLRVPLLRYQLSMLDPAEEEQEIVFGSPARSTPTRFRRTRPWWWKSPSQQNELEESLLSPGIPQWVSESNDAGFSPLRPAQRRSWWPFRRSNRTFDNPRDDGSVDFQSVQEEWASRTEEDPYWWSREEQNVESPPRGDASWLNDSNDV